MFKQKRGQITAFIIIGLILVLSLSIYILINQKYNITPREINIENVRGKVELCLIQNTEKALVELGGKNGYVYDVDFAKSISNKDYEINKDIIEEQIIMYLKDNLAECINNFEDIKKYYDITYSEEFDPEVMYKEENIILKLNYPLIIRSSFNEKIRKTEDFEVMIPVRFKLILDIKDKIESKENSENFVSNYLVNNLDVPVKQRHQSLEEYQKLLVDFVAARSKKYLKNIKIRNTDYEKSDQDIVWGISEEIYPKINIEFSYQRLPLDFDKASFDLKQKYNEELLKYSNYLKKNAFDIDFLIKVPISVKINDKLSFRKKGYEFGFVLPVDLNFDVSNKNINTKQFYLDVYSVQTDNEFKSFGDSKRLSEEDVVVQIYNNDYYDVALYPYDQNIKVPAEKKELQLEVLLFKDYELIGGYKSELNIEDFSKTKLKLEILMFTDLSENVVMNLIDSKEYGLRHSLE